MCCSSIRTKTDEIPRPGPLLADERMLLEYNRARRLQAINDAPLAREEVARWWEDGFVVVQVPDGLDMGSLRAALVPSRPGPPSPLL